MVAASTGNKRAVQQLLDAGADVNARHSAALSAAVSANHGEIMRLLIAAGINMRPQKWEYGESPLMTAIRRHSLPQVTALTEAGCDIEEANSRGFTPLLSAAGEEYTPVLRHLIKCGADLSARTQHGLNAVALAAAGGHELNIAILDSAGVDIDIPDSEGATPLMHALFSGHAEAAEKLIALGADLHAVNTYGTSVQTYAARFSAEMETLIEQAIAGQAEAEKTQARQIKKGLPIEDKQPGAPRIMPRKKGPQP